MPIYEYKKGGKTHYYYAFEVKDKKGKRKTIKKRGFTGKTEAREAEREARVAWKNGQYVDPSSMTVTEYMTEWLSKKNDISDETRETNEGHIKNHITPHIGSQLFQKVTVTDIEDWVATLKSKEIDEGVKLSSGTIRKIFNLMQTCFRSALKKEHIGKNPFDMLDSGSKPQTSKPKVDYWTDEEVRNFFKELDRIEHRHKLLFVLAIYTGMRRGEILGLRWKDVDLKTNQIRAGTQTLKPRRKIKEGGKNKNATRSISISSYVSAELKKQKALIIQEKWEAKENYNDHDLVICHPDGSPISVSNFSKFWTKILEKTGARKIRFHDLRHTCASLLLSAGAHPKVVQEMLGHSSIKITLDLYSHLMPNMQADAVKALDKMLN